MNNALDQASTRHATPRYVDRRRGRHSKHSQRTRRRLRAVLATITLLLLGLGLAIAHWGAVHAQRSYRRFVQLIAEPGVYRAVERRYRGGWISSQAVTELDINSRWLKSALGIDTGGRPLTLLLDHRIQHGPLLFPQSGGMFFGVALITTELDMSAPAMRRLRNWFPGGVPFSAETRIDFTGATDTEIEVPRGKLPAGFDGNRKQFGITWAGITGFLLTSPSLSHYEAAAYSGGIRLSGPFGSLRVLSATVADAGDLDPNGHWKIRQRVSLQRILAREPQDTFSDGLDIEFAHVLTRIASKPDANRASSLWRLRNIRIGSTRIHSLDADMQVTHWNNATLEWLARLGLNTAAEPDAKGSAPALPNSAKRSVVTVRSLRIHMHKGTVEGRFGLVYAAHRGASMLASISGHGTLVAPATLVKSLIEDDVQQRLAAQAAVDPSVPTDPALVANEVAARSARHVSQLLKEGALRRDGGQLTSTLRIDAGKVTVGGVPVAQLLRETPAN